MNLAFYGCSKIGRKIVEALKNDERFVLFGCASRDYSRCLEYKNELGFQKAYESLSNEVKDYLNIAGSEDIKTIIDLIKEEYINLRPVKSIEI